jgi:hypothetical protein
LFFRCASPALVLYMNVGCFTLPTALLESISYTLDLSVTAEVVGSRPVVPAIYSRGLRTYRIYIDDEIWVRIIRGLPKAGFFLFCCSSIQLIPDLIPMIGRMDDMFVIWLTKKWARKLVDQKAWQECNDWRQQQSAELVRQQAKSNPRNGEEPQWKIYSRHFGAWRRR